MAGINSALVVFSTVLLLNGGQLFAQRDQLAAPETIKQLPSSIIHVASSDKRENTRQTLRSNAPFSSKIIDVSSRQQPWQVSRRLYAAVPLKFFNSLSTQLDEPAGVERKVADIKTIAVKPSPGKPEQEEQFIQPFTTELYHIPLIDKNTNSVEQTFPNLGEDNVSRFNKEPGLQTKRFIRVSERLGRIRKRRPADIYQASPTRRRQKKRKAAVETDSQSSHYTSDVVAPATVTMTPLSELEIKSDQDLQKSLHRTTMRTVNYGPLEIAATTTTVGLIGHHQQPTAIFPPHPHSAPVAHDMPALVAPTFTPSAQVGGPPHASTSASNTGNNKTEQYEQLGCGFDLITQSCKDVFGIGWCQQCHDFGNIFLHDCKCTSVTGLYVNAVNAFASAAAAANANAALNANIANQTLTQQQQQLLQQQQLPQQQQQLPEQQQQLLQQHLPQKQPLSTSGFALQPFNIAPSGFSSINIYPQQQAGVVVPPASNLPPPTPLLPSYPYSQQQRPDAGGFRSGEYAHVASPNGRAPPEHNYSLTRQQVASAQQSSNAY